MRDFQPETIAFLEEHFPTRRKYSDRLKIKREEGAIAPTTTPLHTWRANTTDHDRSRLPLTILVAVLSVTQPDKSGMLFL